MVQQDIRLLDVCCMNSRESLLSFSAQPPLPRTMSMWLLPTSDKMHSSGPFSGWCEVAHKRQCHLCGRHRCFYQRGCEGSPWSELNSISNESSPYGAPHHSGMPCELTSAAETYRRDSKFTCTPYCVCGWHSNKALHLFLDRVLGGSLVGSSLTARPGMRVTSSDRVRPSEPP